MSPSRVVILGHTGFLGQVLAAELRARGTPVVGVSAAVADLTRPDSAAAVVPTLDRETGLIVAAAPRSRGNIVEIFEENVAIAATVARVLVARRVATCVYLSTASVYGDASSNLAIDEETAIAPTSFYGVGKVAGELVLRRVAEMQGIPLVILRPCRLYGPGDAGATYGPTTFIRSILDRKVVELWGEGSELRDHVYMRDAARIVLRLLVDGRAGTFNVATGESRSYLEIVEHLRTMIPLPFTMVCRERTRPWIDQRFDVARLRAAIPGLQFTPLEQGLAETCRNARAVAAQSVARSA